MDIQSYEDLFKSHREIVTRAADAYNVLQDAQAAYSELREVERNSAEAIAERLSKDMLAGMVIMHGYEPVLIAE